MAAYLILSLIVLAVAVVVLLLAGSASNEDWDVRGFVRDLRHGITARRHPAPEQVEAARIAQAEPVDTSMDVFFRETAIDEDAYVNVDTIAETLSRAKDLAVRGMHGLTRH